MPQWKDIEFANITAGMATNPANLGNKYAKRILNMHNHEAEGKLKLRPGYTLKYEAPVCPIKDNRGGDIILNQGYINFDVFFDRQAVSEGKEITCLIQKAKIHSLRNDEEIQDMLNIWIRPYWNDYEWIDNWEWLNKTIITEISRGSSETYPNMIYIRGGAENGITNNLLNKYTIYNKTKEQYARVISSVVSEGSTRICHTLYESSWDAEDTVFIGKNWTELKYHNELFNVDWREITFHRILNDLRIGFGGYENRPGLVIGYRKKYFQLNSFDFSTIHADTEGEETLKEFAKTDEVILDTHTINPDGYGIELKSISDPTTTALEAGTYYFRLTGIIDGYQEVLLAENSIEIPENNNISPFPYKKTGRDNSRVTAFNLYISTENIAYYLIRKYTFSSDEFLQKDWVIDENGRYIQKYTNSEIYTFEDACNRTNEKNTAGNWEIFYQGNPYNHKVISTTDEVAPSEYILYCGTSPYTRHDYNEILGCAIPIEGLNSNTYYEIKFYCRKDINCPGQLRIVFTDSMYQLGDRQIKNITITETWAEYTVQAYTGTSDIVPTKLAFGIKTEPTLGNTGFFIDHVSIHEMKRGDLTGEYTKELGAEMKTALGYTPSYNLVKGWDQVLTFRGRAYYLNPYIEKRYENYIIVSHIHSNGSFMYDIASFSNYRELEKFDSNKAIGIALLSTMDILILKDASLTVMSEDGTTGIIREPVFGIGCISRNSIVNMNGIILFCAGEDIYLLNINNGLVPKPLLKDTIRDLYLELSDKESIQCIRDKYNTYRLRTYKPDLKTEYLFTENGWIEEKKWHFPEIYRAGFQNKLYFLAAGAIYTEEAELDYSATTEIIMTNDLITDID